MAETLSRQQHPAIKRITVGETAEGFLEALMAQGVENVFLNPGTDTFPIQEAVTKMRSEGREPPNVVLCLFEIVALAAAHGYYAATGRPQAVLVHVDVGTQNLGSMLHNAQRGRAAVLIAAGRAPYTADPDERGSRSSYIHWLQEQLDQHGIVRNYVKWDYELRRADQVGEAVARGFQIAAGDPPGPVYMTLPREVLMEQPGEVEIYPSERHQPVKLGDGGRDALQRATRMLVEAERPLVLTADVGRTEAGYHGLLNLAEQLALPVVEWRNRANFPSDHPLHQGYDAAELLREADVVLALDHDHPYIPTQMQPPAEARIIQIDVDPAKERIPLWTFPVDLPIRADSSQALPVLAELTNEMLNDSARDRIETRREALTERHHRLRGEWRTQAEIDADGDVITLDWLGYCLARLQESYPNAIFVDETVTSNSTMWKHVPVREPGTWFVSGGSGLGWGLGASLGVKLAHRDRPVVALVGDGSFVFGAPLAALWAMARQDAPVMVVILNNTCYNATKRPLVAAYPEGYSVREDRFVGIDIDPPPRYDKLAEAAGAHGMVVTEPGKLQDELRSAMERTQQGQSVVVDVHLPHPE